MRARARAAGNLPGGFLPDPARRPARARVSSRSRRDAQRAGTRDDTDVPLPERRRTASAAFLLGRVEPIFTANCPSSEFQKY